MTTHSVFGPLAAQVLWTMVVWFWMYVTRVSSIRRNRVRVQDLAEDSGMERIKDAQHPADNFENLFEIPVLFFVLLLALEQTHLVDGLYVVGAWFFVLTRVLHSLVHCTFNHIMTRFTLYVVGSLTVFAMWVRFAISV